MTTTSPTAATDRHWALFADWCSAIDLPALPATPATVLAFLAELPAGPATVRRRVLAIDAAHHRAGYPPPPASPAFDALLRPSRPPRFDPDLIAAALAIIPVGGWPTGIVGRRDAALVALVCTAGLSRRQIQTLDTTPTARRNDLRPGAAGESVAATTGPATDPGTCPACALSRWQWVASMTAAAGWRTVRNHLADLGETTAGDETTHDCTRPAGEVCFIGEQWAGGRVDTELDTTGLSNSRPIPLFCAIDRHGTPQTGYPLSTRSITTIIAARLTAGAAHAGRGHPATIIPDHPGPFTMWSSEDHARVVAARRAATDHLASFETDLDEADAYAEAILQRLEAELASGPD